MNAAARPLIAAPAAAFLLLIMTGPAGAQKTVAEAKERFNKGMTFVDEGDCKSAIVEFKESWNLFPTSVVLYNLALCYDTLHQYDNAAEHYRMYLSEAKNIPPPRYGAIKERIEKLEKLIGTLSLRCNVDGAEVFLDGEKLGTTPLDDLQVNTGTRKLEVKKEKYEDHSVFLKIVSGKKLFFEVNLEQVKEKKKEEDKKDEGEKKKGEEKGRKARTERRKLPPAPLWGTLGTAAVLAAGAGVVGVLNLLNHQKFLETQYEDRDRWKLLKDRGEIYNNVFIGLSAAAGVALVVALVLVPFTDFKSRKEKWADPGKKPFTAGLAPTGEGGLLVVSIPLGM